MGYKTAILLGGTLVACTTGVIYYLKDIKKIVKREQEVKEEVQETKNEQQNQTNNRGQQDNNEKTDQFFLDGSQLFDIGFISAILEQSLDFVNQEYVDFTINNRRERRQAKKKDQDKYDELVLEYNAGVEKILLTALDEILQELNIDKQQYEKSINELVTNGFYQQLYMLQSAVRQKIGEKLPYTKTISLQTTKEIIKYQLHILQNQQQLFVNMINQLSTQPEIAQLIPQILNTMLQDMIYEQFGVEEEDQMRNMSGQDVLNDPEIHSLLQQIEEAMLNLMNSLGLTYVEEEEELEEIERQREGKI